MTATQFDAQTFEHEPYGGLCVLTAQLFFQPALCFFEVVEAIAASIDETPLALLADLRRFAAIVEFRDFCEATAAVAAHDAVACLCADAYQVAGFSDGADLVLFEQAQELETVTDLSSSFLAFLNS